MTRVVTQFFPSYLFGLDLYLIKKFYYGKYTSHWGKRSLKFKPNKYQKGNVVNRNGYTSFI